MNDDAVWRVLSDVFRKLFDTEVALSRSTTAADVEGWDSLAHIQLLLMLERQLGIRFNTGEMAAMKNVGDMVDIIGRRLQGADAALIQGRSEPDHTGPAVPKATA